MEGVKVIFEHHKSRDNLPADALHGGVRRALPTPRVGEEAAEKPSPSVILRLRRCSASLSEVEGSGAKGLALRLFKTM